MEVFQFLLWILTVAMSSSSAVENSDDAGNKEDSILTGFDRTRNENRMRVKRGTYDLIDPFSLLGLLSFATFVITVLYEQYKKRGQDQNPSGPGLYQKQPQGGRDSLKVGPMSQATVEHVIATAQKLFLDSADGYQGTDTYSPWNYTDTGSDYYEEEFEKRNLKSGESNRTRH